MKETMQNLGMEHGFQGRMGKLPPTRKRGQRAIDHVWCTRGVSNKIRKCGIVPRDLAFVSDHLGLFIDVKFEGLPSTENRREGREVAKIGEQEKQGELPRVC